MHPDRFCDWIGKDHSHIGQYGKDACTNTNTTGLLHLLIRTVSKGGNLEINFGPEGDGRISPAMVEPLLGVGRWLETNGESIYGTRAFPFGRNVSECSSDSAAQTDRPAKCTTFRTEADGSKTVYVLYFRMPQLRGATQSTRKISLDHLRPTQGKTVATQLPFAAPLRTSGGASGAPFEIEVPVRGPDDLRCEHDLCHAFVFKITHVQ